MMVKISQVKTKDDCPITPVKMVSVSSSPKRHGIPPNMAEHSLYGTSRHAGQMKSARRAVACSRSGWLGLEGPGGGGGAGLRRCGG
eukprot:3311087-Prymnesium_polylepis.1